MVHEDNLSDVLSEFARTLVTDFPIQSILEHLVGRIVQILPVTAAGVTLITEGSAPRYVAASDPSALRFEKLQTQIGEGPCLLAFDSGEAVAVPDLRLDGRFPRFAPAAVAAGLVAVFTFPLRHGEGRLGALDLYRDTAGRLSASDMVAAQTLADVAAAYLLNAQARSDAQETSDAFEHSSLHDPLTGLPNRLLLQERLERAAARARRSHAPAAILFADLDRFKLVNDVHGHEVGDGLLVAVAQRLSGLVRPGDTLARFSGDEFVILCEDLSGPEDVSGLVRRIDEALARPFVLGDSEHTISASVGTAYAGSAEDISNSLVVRADFAMYEAKRKGHSGHLVLDLHSFRESHDREALEKDLRAAFAAGDLRVAYQPVVTSVDGQVAGVEALLRWTDDKRGAVPPLAMVGVAERSDLISGIGAWVLERGCRDRALWLTAHPQIPLDLAVNVSARQLLSRSFGATVADVLARTGMDPTALVVEVTENVFVGDGDRAVAVLAALKDTGVRVAIDDFGTGYSSLSYLRRLPVDIVKIDRSFIVDIGRVASSATIVAAVANLAHALGLAVTAEGIETEHQRDEILAIGCELAQGFFYGRPMSADATSAYLRDQSDRLIS